MPSFFIIVLTVILGVWLNRVHGSLDHLTWGWVRRLDAQKKRGLVARAESWLAHREPYRITTHMLTLANLAALAMTLQRLLLTARAPFSGWGVSLACALGAAVLFVAALEALDHTRQAGPHWRLLAFSMPVVRATYLLFYPIVKPVCYLRAQTMAWNEDQVEDDERATTEDEILSLVEEDAHEEDGDGALEPSERRMIRGIFELEKTIVREIMTPRVDIKSLPVTATLATAKHFIVDCKHSRVPVYRESVDDIVGIVLAKDLLDDAQPASATLEAVMHDPYFVPETKDVKELLEEFKQARLQVAVVIDEYGGTAGLVSIEDILEEIVGEIQDEYDTHEVAPTVTPAPDGTLEVEARTPIDEIIDALGVAIPREAGFDTIGGYVTSALGRIPKPAETCTIGDLDITILAADDRKIARLRLKRSAVPTEPAAHD